VTDRGMDETVDGVAEDNRNDYIEEMNCSDGIIFSGLAGGVTIRELPFHHKGQWDPKEFVKYF
jgi:hypothetical protein